MDSAFLERFCCLHLHRSLSLLRKGLDFVGTEKNDHKVSGTRSIVHSSVSNLDDVSDGCENGENSSPGAGGSRKRSVYWGTDDHEWLVN